MNTNIDFTQMRNERKKEQRKNLIEQYKVEVPTFNYSKWKAKCQKSKYPVTAISGMSAAGKTALSDQLLLKYPDMVFFDFGEFYRTITYYFSKEMEMSKEEIQNYFCDSNQPHALCVDFEIENRACKIKINHKTYEETTLHNPEMDQLTVDIGVILGDKLNSKVKEIIDRMRENSPVLLNARRPIATYEDIENHIFLKANFQERARRRAKQDGEPLNEAISKAMRRDQKEKNGGFWEIFPFTKVIDTTNLSLEEVTLEVSRFIESKYKKESER